MRTTQQQQRVPLTYQDVRAWLAARPDVPFTPRSASQCPLAVYAREQTPGAAVAFVEADAVEVLTDSEQMLWHQRLPLWAQRFVRRVDAHGRYLRNGVAGWSHDPLTGAEALRLLDAARHQRRLPRPPQPAAAPAPESQVAG